jgi:hypothetical protein
MQRGLFIPDWQNVHERPRGVFSPQHSAGRQIDGKSKANGRTTVDLPGASILLVSVAAFADAVDRSRRQGNLCFPSLRPRSRLGRF